MNTTRLRMTGTALAIALASAALLTACGGDDDSGGGAISNEGNEELFTSSGFQEALDAAEEDAGDDAGVLQLQITEGGASFKLRDGEQATGFVYTGGELVDQEVEIIGGGSLEGQDFPLADIDAAAIDKIVDGVKTESGLGDVQVTVMTLEKSSLDGELGWVVNAEGDGRSGLVFNADLDGSNVTSPTGAIAGAEDEGDTGTTTPSGTSTDDGAPTAPGAGADEAQEVAQCVQDAQGDIAKIQECAK